MARARRFKPGQPVANVVTVVALIEAGHWFYLPFTDVRPTSPKVLRNMSVAVLDAFARHGRLRLALPQGPRP